MEKEKNYQLMMMVAVAFFAIGFITGYFTFYQGQNQDKKDFLEEEMMGESREELPTSLLEGVVDQVNTKEEYIMISVRRPIELRDQSLKIIVRPNKISFRETLLSVYSIDDVRKVAVREITFNDIGIGGDVLVAFDEDVLFLIENEKELEAKEIILITAEDV